MGGGEGDGHAEEVGVILEGAADGEGGVLAVEVGGVEGEGGLADGGFGAAEFGFDLADDGGGEGIRLEDGVLDEAFALGEVGVGEDGEDDQACAEKDQCDHSAGEGVLEWPHAIRGLALCVFLDHVQVGIGFFDAGEEGHGREDVGEFEDGLDGVLGVGDEEFAVLGGEFFHHLHDDAEAHAGHIIEACAVEGDGVDWGGEDEVGEAGELLEIGGIEAAFEGDEVAAGAGFGGFEFEGHGGRRWVLGLVGWAAQVGVNDPTTILVKD